MAFYKFIINVHLTLFYNSIEDLEEMFDLGLYIDDLSMHDSSRDLVLAGMQQSAELKLALDQVRSPCLIHLLVNAWCLLN